MIGPSEQASPSDPIKVSTLTVQLPSDGFPEPEGANWFFFSTVGDEFQMLIGYMDLRIIADATHGQMPENSLLKPDISHRIYMGPQAFQFLRMQIEDIARQRGLPPVSQGQTV